MASAVSRPNAAAAKAFAERVSRVSRVAAVYEVALDSALGVWTLLDRSNAAIRDVVYALELAILQQHPAAEIDFRVIDLAEVARGAVDEVLPSGARAIWIPPPAAAPSEASAHAR